MLNRHKAGPTCASNVGKRNTRTLVVHLFYRGPGCRRAHRLHASPNNGPHVTYLFSIFSCRQHIGEAGKLSSKELNSAHLHNDQIKSMRRWTHEKMGARYAQPQTSLPCPNTESPCSISYIHTSHRTRAFATSFRRPKCHRVLALPTSSGTGPHQPSGDAVRDEHTGRGVECVSVRVVEVVRMSHGVVV